MSKPYCVVSAPVDCYSGYSSRSRDFVKALYELKKDEWDIQILSQRWGNTPWGYLNDHYDWTWMKALIVPNNQMQKQPDYWFMITVPNEFQPIGKLANIGVTAGIETTVCDASWIEGVNRMDLTLVSSNHAKKVFETSAFEQRDQQNKVISQVRLQKPVQVLFEGVNLNQYVALEQDHIHTTKLVKSLDETVKEDFNFLLVGHWLQGEIGEDRKNIGATIRTFLNTFKNKKKKPGLILKASSVGSCIMDRYTMLEKINSIRRSIDSKDLPNIYLLHGEMDEEDMNNLYNHKKVKAMLFLTKGEGFGRPLLEFCMVKKPIIVSAWSGHMDFIHDEYSVLVGGELTKVHPSAVVQNMILPDSMWFSYNEKDASDKIRNVFENYSKYIDNAKRQAHFAKTNFSFDKMKEELGTVVDKFPRQIPMKLPQLKKIQMP